MRFLSVRTQQIKPQHIKGIVVQDIHNVFKRKCCEEGIVKITELNPLRITVLDAPIPYTCNTAVRDSHLLHRERHTHKAFSRKTLCTLELS